MKKNRILAAIGILAAIATVSAGAYAYFNGHTAPKVNRFNIVGGDHDIEKGEIVEPNWDPQNAVNLVPSQTVPKDPQFQSGVDYEAYAFMKVEMPQVRATLDPEGEYAYTDAFTYNVNDGWVLVGEKPTTSEGGDHIYLYMYGANINTPTLLPANGRTTALFNEITVPDFARCLAKTGTLDIEGFSEQSAGVDLATALADAREWATIQ